MSLAIFDLDNTLLRGDSDHVWGEFLIAKGLVNADIHASRNDRFYQHYTEGTLNINDYVRFTLDPVLDKPIVELEVLREEFMRSFIIPIFLPRAQDLITHHKSLGDYCLIISATNSFITEPIARALKVHDILATDLKVKDGFYTGEIAGMPCFKEGKVGRLKQWIKLQNEAFILADSIFYSDSINDLPLLEAVATPVAVDPDEKLEALARQKSWKIISLR
ncbi:MAG: HAD family hydrolase [Gammaproteobacteria bacterium]|nr:HAD family hydrolase [Gammaproteobacteria bacterium]